MNSSYIRISVGRAECEVAQSQETPRFRVEESEVSAPQFPQFVTLTMDAYKKKMSNIYIQSQKSKNSENLESKKSKKQKQNKNDQLPARELSPKQLKRKKFVKQMSGKDEFGNWKPRVKSKKKARREANKKFQKEVRRIALAFDEWDLDLVPKILTTGSVCSSCGFRFEDCDSSDIESVDESITAEASFSGPVHGLAQMWATYAVGNVLNGLITSALQYVFTHPIIAKRFSAKARSRASGVVRVMVAVFLIAHCPLRVVRNALFAKLASWLNYLVLEAFDYSLYTTLPGAVIEESVKAYMPDRFYLSLLEMMQKLDEIATISQTTGTPMDPAQVLGSIMAFGMHTFVDNINPFYAVVLHVSWNFVQIKNLPKELKFPVSRFPEFGAEVNAALSEASAVMSTVGFKIHAVAINSVRDVCNLIRGAPRFAYVKLPEIPRPKFEGFPTFENFRSRMGETLGAIDMSPVVKLFESLMTRVSEDMMDFGLSVLSFLYRLYRIQSVTDLFMIAMDFLRSTIGVKRIMEIAAQVYDFIKSSAIDLLNKLVVRSNKITAESRLKVALKGLKSSLTMAMDSALVTALRDFVLSIISFKIFSKEGTKNITNLLGPAKPCNGLELLSTTLEAAIQLVTASESTLEGKPLGEILCSSNPVQKFLEVVDELDALQTLTYSGLPVPDRVCRREYMMRVVAAIKDGDILHESQPTSSPHRKTLANGLRKLKGIKAIFLNAMTAETRPMPYAVCLEGMPGIGKGTLLDYVCMVWSRAKDREFSHTHVYHRQKTEEYWSGYEPLSKPIIHYSEPGSINRKIAETKGDKVMDEFLSVADNQPFQCNMADLESKGRVYALPELLVLDCNDPTMNIDVLVNNPAAIRRRLLYIRPTVKQEFKMGSTCRMDQAKSLASDKPILDRWRFEVYKMEPKNNKESLHVVKLDNVGIYELTDWLLDDFKQHIGQQEERAKLVQKIDINDYIDKMVYPECAVLGHQDVEPPRDWRQIGHGAWKTFQCYALLFGVYTLMLIAWFSSNGYAWKAYTMKRLQEKEDNLHTQGDAWWRYTRLALGHDVPSPRIIKQDGKVSVAIKSDYINYIAVFTAVLIFAKCVKVGASIWTEGGLLSTEVRSEEQVDESIATTERKSEAVLPPKREKRGNGVDWDGGRTFHQLVSHENQTKGDDAILNAVERNRRIIVVKSSRGDLEMHALGVMSDFAIVNYHAFDLALQDSYPIRVETRSNVPDHIGARNSSITPTEMCQINGDLWLVRLTGCKFRDIRSYFVADKHVAPKIGAKGFLGRQSVLVTEYNRPIEAKAPKSQKIVVSCREPLAYDCHHSGGTCGTPLLVNYINAWGIAGVHIAGTDKCPNGGTTQAFAEKIWSTVLEKAVESLSKTTVSVPVMSEGSIRLPPNVKGLEPVSARSPLRYEVCPSLESPGSMDGYSALKPGKSRLRSTEFIRVAEQLTGVSPFKDGKPIYAPPSMTHRINNGQYVAPYNHFIKKSGVIKKSLDPRIMRLTIDTVKKHLVKGLRERGVTSLQPVPLSVAQNGYPLDFYMRAMRPSTSGGWAWPGAKKKYSRQCCLDFKKEAYMPLFDVKNQVVEQLLAYEKGQDAVPLLGAQLKDEPRGYEKVLNCQTRVFCMSSYESTLVSRMYLMPIYSLMVEHGDLFMTSIGINMHSTDVDELVEYLTELFPDEIPEESVWRFLAGDYGDFDTSMPTDVGLMSNTVTYELAEEFGYNDHALQMTQGVLSDNLTPMVVVEDNLVVMQSLQPSGKYGTAEDNSLRGLCMLVYAWIVMMTEHGKGESFNLTIKFGPDDFFIHVRARVYGDDFLGRVSLHAQMFSNWAYRDFCRDVYGLRYTSPFKDRPLEEFYHLDEVSFLKRSFKYRKDLKHWVAPLERTSIMKTICYYLPSNEVTYEEQIVDSCVSAMRELFFHTEREDYDVLRHQFAARCAEFYQRNFEDMLRVFPSFDQIRQSLYPDDDTKMIEQAMAAIPFLIDAY